ncbi:MAG: 16S rRNA (uracil(1498)-N(3))-methyltransferase [Phycisphaerales bacterium]|nr:16S rRNA (uracil(1498)-N(3))-methyltransferase [Phycisphaerales bacterium]
MSTDRSIQHYLMFSDLASSRVGGSIEVSGQEAHHAVRVKRVRVGDSVGLLDGQGAIGIGVIEQLGGSKSKPVVGVELISIEQVGETAPRVEVWSALPKGDPLDRMIDQLSQLGVALFRPLICERSQRKPETVRIDKLERIAVESAKQCHRPWLLEIGDPINFAQAIKEPDVIVADGSGNVDMQQIGMQQSDNSRVVLLVGPEGGWSVSERELIRATSVPMCRFGVFVLRIEAAACAASAIVLGASVVSQGSS